MINTLYKKVALVTGASTGIGRSASLKLAELGADVIVNYYQSEKEARETAAVIEQMNRKCLVIKADVTVKSAVDDMINQAIKIFGSIDVLVNNAGSPIKSAPFLECDYEVWSKTIDLNLTAAYYCCQAVIPHMIKQKFGRIINISSVATKSGAPHGGVHYAAAKSGLETLTRGLAKEFARQGIRVNAIAPGPIDTPFHHKWLSEEVLRSTLRKVPAGRIGKPEEVAATIAFLASELADYINGEVIFIDGGMS